MKKLFFKQKMLSQYMTWVQPRVTVLAIIYWVDMGGYLTCCSS